MEQRRLDNECIVVHVSEPHDYKVTRPGLYGNPFYDGTKQENVRRFTEWFYDNVQLKRQAFQELTGKRIACYCTEKPCHADVIARFVNNANLIGTCVDCLENDLDIGTIHADAGMCARCWNEHVPESLKQGHHPTPPETDASGPCFRCVYNANR